MFFAKSLLSTVLTATLAITASVEAQSLDGAVVRNPDDTVTYTIDLDGPPRGTAFVLMAFQPTPNPFQLPGIIHSLLIDPSALFVLSESSLDPSGYGLFQFTAPPPVTSYPPLFFQSLVIDAQFHLAFSVNRVQLWLGND